MKRALFTLVLGIVTCAVMAQVPAAFSYQAVVRNNSGDVLANKNVRFRMTILRDSETGTPVYGETHSVTTNDFGMANLKVGMGTTQSGSIDPSVWGGNSHFLKVELDPENGTSFTLLGTVQLLAVPYAFHAKTVENDKVNDADADPANEIQTLTKTGNTISLSGGGGSVTDEVNDDDHDAANEIQALSISGTLLTLSKGGGSVPLPSAGGGDNWGTQAVVADATLSGNGTTADPLTINDNGVTSGKILDGTVSNADLSDNAVTSLKITDGSIATADLANSLVTADKLGNLAVSNAKIQNGAVTTDKLADLAVSSAKIQDGGVTADKLASGAVTTVKIAAAAVTGDKIAQAGATSGQVLKWSGTSWNPDADLTGGSLWTQSGSNLFYNTGKVGIGKDPGVDYRQFQVLGGANIAIAAENSTTVYATLYARNNSGGGVAAFFENASGPVARFGRNIVISDGTQGTGKVLTSDANGLTSWQIPSYSKWLLSGNDIYYNEGKVGIGGANTSNAQFQVKTTGSEIARFESTASSNWIGMYTSGVRKGILWMSGNTLTLRSDEGGVNIKTNGNNDRLTIEDDGDITTPLTGSNKNIVPVAYGYVNQLGVLNTAKSTSNVSATVTGSAGNYNYIVTVTGVTANSFIALVTPGGDYISFPRLMYEGNTFTVNFMSHTGSTGQANNFSFVVFAP